MLMDTSVKMLLKCIVNSLTTWKNMFFCECIVFILNAAWLISYRYCHSYEDENLEIVIPPILKEGEKIHYMLFQDESCMHANDQSMYVWQEEGVQPLCSKTVAS